MAAPRPTGRPTLLPVAPDGIPPELRARPQWVCVRLHPRDGRWTKVPHQVDGRRAAADDPSTWASFAQVLAAYHAGGWDGIGYVFAADDPYGGLDLDHVCGDPARTAWARDLVRSFGSYAEWSPGGDGIHIIGAMRMPDAGPTLQKGRADQAKGLEAYSARRFFTVTGHRVPEASTRVVPCQAALDRLLAHEFAPQTSTPAPVRLAAGIGDVLGDDDQTRLEKMFRGKRGAELRALWAGGSARRKPTGDPDPSADDLSLLNALAFWLDKDPRRMAAAFRASGRNRPKLDERHSADGRSYLELSIGEAIGGCTASYGELIARRAAAPAPTPAPAINAPPIDDEVAALRAEVARLTAEVARLNRALLERDDQLDELAGVIQVQQAGLAVVRAEHADCRATFRALKDVVANKHLRGNEVRVALITTWEIESQRSRGIATPTVPLAAVGEKAGVSKNTASRVIRQLSEGADAPFERQVTRERRRGPDGEMQWASALLVRPRTASSSETLRAIAAYAPKRARHGGTPQAAAARWQCQEHPKADVIVTATARCATCAEVVGEPTITVIAAERRLNHQLGDSDGLPPHVDVGVLRGHQDGDSGGADGGLVGCRAREAEVVPAHTSGRWGWLAAPGAGGRAQPWRCRCGCLERYVGWDGRARCDGCTEVITS